MNASLRELYQELIVDHSRHPRNFGKLDCPTCSKEGVNPLCGDKLTLHIQLNNERLIENISFEGSGCAISMASASLMTESLKGHTIQHAQKVFEQFHHMLTNQQTDLDALGKLSVMAGVSDYPMRVKCATLAWHTLNAALHDDNNHSPITTE